MLRDDGSTLQVYQVAGELSKGMHIYRNQNSSQDHEHDGLLMIRCRKLVTKADTRPDESVWCAESVGLAESAQGVADAVQSGRSIVVGPSGVAARSPCQG